MTTPTIRAIKQKYKNCRLVYATDFSYLNGALAAVLQGNPYIDEVVDHAKVREDDFDVYISLTCPCVAHEVPKAPPIHRIDLFARHAQVVLEDKSMIYVMTEEERGWGKAWLEKRGVNKFHKVILISPFASHWRRSWDVRKWQETIGLLTQSDKDIRVITVTHSSDYKQVDWNQVNSTVMHNFGVRQIAAVLANTNLCICTDSALLHLAQAMNHPTVAVFGPTDPAARCNYSPNTAVVCYGDQIAAHPCYYDGACPCNLTCMRLIGPQEVTTVALKKLYGEELPARYNYYRSNEQMISTTELIPSERL